MSDWSKKISLKTLTLQFDKYKDSNVYVAGWVKSLRASKSCNFLMINDGSMQADLQIVIDASHANYEESSKLLTGSSVFIFGKAVSSQGKQKVELQLVNLKIIDATPVDYPLQKKATSLEYLREVAHVRARTNTLGAILRIRHTVSLAVHRFFDEQGFTYVHTPIITSSDCEGAGELFRVTSLDPNEKKNFSNGKMDFSKDYFGQSTYLAVSGQLEGEALAHCLSSIYTFGPTFRSENSNTSRHLSEFWMIEPEIAFAELPEVIALAQNFIKYLLKEVLEKHPEELAFFEQHYKPGLVKSLDDVYKAEFKVITYTDAVDILLSSKKNFDYKVEWGVDLQSEHERYLTDEHFKAPVVVTNYPAEIKAFYMKLSPDGKTVKAMDMLVPGVGEIIGGSEREDRLNVLQDKMTKKGLNLDDYWWYLDLRKFGSTPHGGFGLGLERFLMYVTGMSNIRDVIAFPRFPQNAKF
jgi:asparaginyl-tRNA synthetase